ncbi:MAG: hypothetical protein LQ351_004738 [Letrouitia transgressa]|nr:MAG: hypothetical protein LQ351_004738 [Letrouitia transgressa]
MLVAGNIKCGRFTSPHLIDRWDCIAINGKSIEESIFTTVEDEIKLRDKAQTDKASEFELLTATAFEIFSREKVDIGIIEVGMGGLHDATNILVNPLVTVITKIGKDHQSFLGNTLEEIAYQKAGIMKRGVPCVVDSTNPKNVLEVFQKTAQDLSAGPVIEIPSSIDYEESHELWKTLTKTDFERHQQVNINLAHEAVRLALEQIGSPLHLSNLLPGIQQTAWPGRIQELSIESLTGRRGPVILDGSHNAQSAEVLGSFVDRKIRCSDSQVTWMVAISAGKGPTNILSPLIRIGDNLVATEFGPVEGMPWVSAASSEEVVRAARKIVSLDQVEDSGLRVMDALLWAAKISRGGPLVIAGSLYLVSDVLRLLRRKEVKDIPYASFPLQSM